MRAKESGLEEHLEHNIISIFQVYKPCMIENLGRRINIGYAFVLIFISGLTGKVTVNM